MEYNGIPWNAMKRHAMEHHGTPWHTMAHHGTPWHTMASDTCLRTAWHRLEHGWDLWLAGWLW